jgi:hypothetical protein
LPSGSELTLRKEADHTLSAKLAQQRRDRHSASQCSQNAERSETIIDIKAQQANRRKGEQIMPIPEESARRRTGFRDESDGQTDFRGKFGLAGISSFHRRCITLLTTLTRRLPVSSGEVATLTPEGVIAFWKFFGKRKRRESP